MRFNKNIIKITTNKFVSNKQIEEFIIQNINIVLDNIYKLEADYFYFRGEKIQNSNINYERKTIKIDNTIFFFNNEDLLNLFYKEKASEIFPILFKECLILFPNIPVNLKIQKMKSRWGVYNHKNKNIKINTALIKCSDELIKSVMYHEICHFYHQNHQKEFYDLLLSVDPNYRNNSKKLKKLASEIL